MTDPFPVPDLAEWAERARREYGGDPDERVQATPEGIDVKPLYTTADIRDSGLPNGLPGFAPFLRGPRATMFTGRPWTIRQYAGFSTAE